MPLPRPLALAAVAALLLPACNRDDKKADADPMDPYANAVFGGLKQGPRPGQGHPTEGAMNVPPSARPQPAPVTFTPAVQPPPAAVAPPVAVARRPAPPPPADDDTDDPPAKPDRPNRPNPFAPTAPADTDPPTAAKTVDGEAIPLKRGNDAVTFGPIGCPVAVVGKDVWDLKGMKAVRTLADGGAYDQRALRALSPDGRFFAAADKSPNQKDTTITVWDTATGDKVQKFGSGPDMYADLVLFRDPTTLLVGGRHGRKVGSIDVTTGKVGPLLTVPDNVHTGKFVVSPDGKLYAYVGHKGVTVADAVTGKKAVVMAPPGPGSVPPGTPPDPFPLVTLHAYTRGAAFSPDGTELALYATHPTPRLIVWNTKGKLLFDRPVSVHGRVGGDDLPPQWLPGGAGWVIDGNIVDRVTGATVLVTKRPFGNDRVAVLADENRLAGVFASDRNEDRLRFVPVPWDKLRRSLKAMTDREPAHIAPGLAVSVDVQLAGRNGAGGGDAGKLITEALTKRLARDGVPVAAGRPTVLKVRLAEAAGETLPIFERRTRFDFRGSDTGRTATEARGEAVVELFVGGEPRPVWRVGLSAASGRSFEQEITDATIRASMLDHLTAQLGKLDLPYFIPKAAEVTALPAVVE